MLTSADPELQIYIAFLVVAGACLLIGMFLRLLANPRLNASAARQGDRTGLLRAAYAGRSTTPPKPGAKSKVALLSRKPGEVATAEGATGGGRSKVGIFVRIVIVCVLVALAATVHFTLLVLIPLVLFSMRERSLVTGPRGLDGELLSPPEAPDIKTPEKEKAKAAAKKSSAATVAAATPATPDEEDMKMLIDARQTKPTVGCVLVLFFFFIGVAAMLFGI